MIRNEAIDQAMHVKLEEICKELPRPPVFEINRRRAPKRTFTLTEEETVLALQNALRYLPEKWHKTMAPEFLEELRSHGRIYGYRFRPEGAIKGKAIQSYKGKTQAGKAIQVMIDNNLDFDIALYPYELVTYGETGQVCQNWMQYRLIRRYLEELTDEQTLVVASGHPVGIFHSDAHSPRVIVTNALMIGMYDDQENWNRAVQLGVANYGQMTAGGWMYIGPQGIVHGTYSTLLNAARQRVDRQADADCRGLLFVSSGLGGMSGAQAKSVEIANGVGIFAEVDASRIKTRHEQGWVSEVKETPEAAFIRAEKAKKEGQALSIAYHGNIVDLLEYAASRKVTIDLLSDQTSCHAVYDGGYCPVDVSFDERTRLLSEEKESFDKMVDQTLKRHFKAIQALTDQGTYFFDYGNSFLKAVFDAGVPQVCKNGKNPIDGFVYPSYVEDLMGPLFFDYGYGPFRWVCLSGDPKDLDKTDQAAMDCIDPNRRFQDRDNYNWIRDAKKNELVVGTQARILYQDAMGRVKIALRFNEMVRQGVIGPIMLGRDHHDTGGTDSPFRETSNIKDGSNIMADMSTHCFAGNAARGMTMVALHNGGGVGIGKAINGGFGLLLDGSEKVDDVIRSAIPWDAMGGVARRGWARNPHAIETAMAYNKEFAKTDHITLPFLADIDALTKLVEGK